jgi:hypothetical protein
MYVRKHRVGTFLFALRAKLRAYRAKEISRTKERVPARLVAKEPCNFYAAGGRISIIESRPVLPILIDGKRALIIKSGSVANLVSSL